MCKQCEPDTYRATSPHWGDECHEQTKCTKGQAYANNFATTVAPLTTAKGVCGACNDKYYQDEDTHRAQCKEQPKCGVGTFFVDSASEKRECKPCPSDSYQDSEGFAPKCVCPLSLVSLLSPLQPMVPHSWRCCHLFCPQSPSSHHTPLPPFPRVRGGLSFSLSLSISQCLSSRVRSFTMLIAQRLLGLDPCFQAKISGLHVVQEDTLPRRRRQHKETATLAPDTRSWMKPITRTQPARTSLRARRDSTCKLCVNLKHH